MVVLFFFKQKTAYEMRISDWSSDVCSSDLPCDPRALATVSDCTITDGDAVRCRRTYPVGGINTPRLSGASRSHPIVKPDRLRPNCQLMPSARKMPDAVLPNLRSSVSRQGTRVKSRDRSTTA